MILGAIRGVLGWLLAPRRRPSEPDTRGAIVYEDPGTRRLRALHSDGTDSALTGGGGGGVTAHTGLTALAWASSGHTGTASRLAAFDGGGAAAYQQVGVDVQAYDAQLAALAGSTPTAGSIHYWTSATAVSVLGIGSPGQLLKVAGGVPTWGTAVAATTTQAFSGSATMTTDVDHVHATASGTLTLPAISSSTIGHSTIITGRATSALTLVLAANAADEIEGAAKLALHGAAIVATLTPVAANRWVVGVVRGLGMWRHCGVDLTAASGSSPWSITTTNGDTTTWTDISAGAGNSVAASSGLEMTSVSASYYSSSTGAVVKTPLSGLLDGWGRALTTRDSFWFLSNASRTTGSTTVPQTGIVLAGTAITTVPKLGVAMLAGGGVLQSVYRLTSNASDNYTETYQTASHWMGGWYAPEVRGFRRLMLSTATSGEPGDEWWPSSYYAALDHRWGQDYHGQMLDITLLTDLHLTQVGATDKFTYTHVSIIRCQVGTEGE